MKHLVEDWMTKHPLKIDKNEDADLAADIMREECIGHLLVTDHGQLAGVLSSRDLNLAGKIKAKMHGTHDDAKISITAGDLMSRAVVTIPGKATVAEAIRKMEEKHFHALPVTDDYKRIRGILTSTDVLRYALVASQQMEVNAPYARLLASL